MKTIILEVCCPGPEKSDHLTNTKMSVKSACARSCIPDSLARHAEIISKAELDADLTEMVKPKWNRSRNCTNNNNSKRRPRSFRGRKKSGSEEIRVLNPTTTSQIPPNDESIMSILDFVDCVALERIPRIPTVADLPNGSHKTKKVHFNEDNLVEVIEFPDDEESEEMRKCYWEVFARDRSRFKDRIDRAESNLKLVLLSDHRQKVYNQRFLPLMNT